MNTTDPTVEDRKQRWQRVIDVFSQAIRLEPDNRAKFIREACKQDAELIRQIESLLEHDERAGADFLAPPPPDPVIEQILNPNADDPLIGQTLGAFTILRVIARGGMGTVYLAEQANPRREVAVKVVHVGLNSREAEKRFILESAVLARLRHPNIAQVYEAGTWTPGENAEWQMSNGEWQGAASDSAGDATSPFSSAAPEAAKGQTESQAPASRAPTLAPRPPAPFIRSIHYFAMEYIPGAKILTEYADDHSLDIRQRLELFSQVCDAVDYGHGRGIIHRDLKPQNLLVDENGVVKVIDFGVARAIDSDVAVTTIQTEAGKLLGTLAYMSPEQCEADPLGLDVRSDVYSLGVVLYELLSGRPPYEVSSTSVYSAIRTIQEAQPRPLSAMNRRLRGDLQTIVEKALSKERQRRYASVADLRRDVRHYLSREPIEARPPTRWVRSLRWMMRHPKLSATAASVAISAVIVGATALLISLANGQPSAIELTLSGNRILQISSTNTPWGDSATLYSLTGKRLGTWKTNEAKIILAKLVDRPQVWGGGQVVILGFGPTDDYKTSKRLCAFNTSAPEKPIWTRTIEPDVIRDMHDNAWPRPSTDPHRTYREDSFSFKAGWVLDVFGDEEHPGEEIVAYFQHIIGSQGCLRIYNLNGDRLFQAWQDGGLHSAIFFQRERVLVFTASKGDMYDHEYGWDLAGNHPRVVFAIKPEAGDITYGWIHPFPPRVKKRYRNDTWQGEWYKPVWYKLLCPLHWQRDYALTSYLIEPVDAGLPSDYPAKLSLHFPMAQVGNLQGYNLEFNIDGEGNTTAQPPTGNTISGAQAKDPTLPKHEEFLFLPWDSPEPPCSGPASQPADASAPP